MLHCTLLARRAARTYRTVPVRRAYQTTQPVLSIVLNHRSTPAERVTALSKEQKREAKELLKEDPLQWTPKNLASRFRVPTSLIQASIQPPPKRMLKLRRQLAQEIKPRAMTPQRQRLESWIQTQIDKTPEHRERKKDWRKKGNYELKDNIDAIERKLAKLQEISLKAMNEARKARKEK